MNGLRAAEVVDLSCNRKKWTKRTAKRRTTIPAPPALAPKNFCEVEKSLFSLGNAASFWTSHGKRGQSR
jgi:hypothetical protein